MKHTPGPWHATADKIGGPDRILVADTWTTDRSREEQAANANLIAAAPDLYEALRLVIVQHDATDCLGPTVAADARAAIAKAEGGAG